MQRPVDKQIVPGHRFLMKVCLLLSMPGGEKKLKIRFVSCTSPTKKRAFSSWPGMTFSEAPAAGDLPLPVQSSLYYSCQAVNDFAPGFPCKSCYFLLQLSFSVAGFSLPVTNRKFFAKTQQHCFSSSSCKCHEGFSHVLSLGSRCPKCQTTNYQKALNLKENSRLEAIYVQ